MEGFQQFLVQPEQLEAIQKLALAVNQGLRLLFSSVALELVDFKIEIGLTPEGQLLLADEISPDSCRLWDLRRPEGAGGVAEPGPLADVYTELARRLGVLPSNVTHAPKPTLIN